MLALAVTLELFIITAVDSMEALTDIDIDGVGVGVVD